MVQELVLAVNDRKLCIFLKFQMILSMLMMLLLWEIVNLGGQKRSKNCYLLCGKEKFLESIILESEPQESVLKHLAEGQAALSLLKDYLSFVSQPLKKPKEEN